MASPLERQLDSLWEQSRAGKARKIEGMEGEICKKFSIDLTALHDTVCQKVSSQHLQLQQLVETTAEMERNYAEGVEIWVAKANTAIADVQREQVYLKRLVEAAGERMEKRKRQLLDSQSQRNRKLQEQCAAIITEFRKASE